MSDSTNSSDTRPLARRIGDSIANAIGGGITGSGYVVGRMAPATRSIGRNLAELRLAKFVYENFAEGYRRGDEAAQRARLERECRRMMRYGNAAMKEAAIQVMADVREFFGSGPDTTPQKG